MVIKEFVILLFESLYISIESRQNVSNSFKVVFFQSSELLNCAKELNKFSDSSAEKIKLAENLVGGELKLFTLGHVH